MHDLTYHPDRYHLYVSYGCRECVVDSETDYRQHNIYISAWATRTLIVRQLKGLEEIIPVTVVSPRLDEHGWPFANIDSFPGAEKDPLYGADHLKDVYLRVSPDYEGRFTVPLLFDKKTESIVNNESSDIIRIFNSAFNHLLPPEKVQLDLYPEPLRSEIDELNAWVYDTVNSMIILFYHMRASDNSSRNRRCIQVRLCCESVCI